MKDLLTVITCMIGEKMEANNENILFESLKINKNTGKDIDWKIDAIKEYLGAHVNDSGVISKCIDMAQDFGLNDEYTKESYWKKIFNSLPNKRQKSNSSRSYSRGCGSSASYGCGESSSRRSYSSGCGGSSSYSRGGC